MIWKPGDKCVLDDSIFGCFLRRSLPTKYRLPEPYVVLKRNPIHSLVLIADKDGKTTMVLESWIVPFKDTIWQPCKESIGKSTGPTDLLKRLNETPPDNPPQPKPSNIPEHLSPCRKTLAHTLDRVDLLLSVTLGLWITLVRVFRTGIDKNEIPD